MRYVVTMLILIAPSISMGITMEEQVLAQLAAQKLARNAVPIKDLAPEIVRLATEVGLSPQLLTAVVLQESGGVALAYNAKSHDHGLMQINQRTAIGLGLTVKCLYDWRCNLRVGARLLAEGARPCSYNVGKYRRIEGGWLDRCNKYETSLALLY